MSEVGIWMVSRAREEGLNGNVTGYIIFVSISNCGVSQRSRKRVYGQKKGPHTSSVDAAGKTSEYKVAVSGTVSLISNTCMVRMNATDTLSSNSLTGV